jgi:serine/threonine-protein kinase
MSEPSAKSFLKLLERSGIVAEDQLKSELGRLSELASGRKVKTGELVDHLVDSGLITKWHTEKLLAGKYKGFFLGKYKLLGHLGSGGMSSVYLAKHKISEQLRAIKVLPRKKVADKSYLDRFYLEARAAASLNHPNVVRIYDICNESDTHYMVMEFVDGSDLYEIVTADGPLSIEDAMLFTAQACEGLTHAHQRELVHRDIKPANLLKTTSGDIKILDLGLALVNQDDSESLTILYNDKVMGTADYLSPEQAVNSHEVDSRADIYSLGCTLYYLLAGHPPFPKGTLAQRIAMHQTKDPADVRESRPDCPEVVVELCQKMMRKDPDDRFQTCVEIKEEIMRLHKAGQLVPVAAEKVGSTVNDSADGSSGNSSSSDSDHSDSDHSGLGEFQIDTTKSGRNSTVAAETQVDQASQSTKKGKPRKRHKAPPKWLLPVLIVLMMIIMIAVLFVCFTLINKEKPATESRLPPYMQTATEIVG